MLENKYNLYIDFVNDIIKQLSNHYLDFYALYHNFNLANNCNLFNLDVSGYKNFVPIVLNYRNSTNNKIFSIIYKIKYYCTEECKYSGGYEEELISAPFIDIPLISCDDNNIKDIVNYLKIIFILI